MAQRLVRPADLFTGTVDFFNTALARGGRALVRVRPGEPASVVLKLPPQHFMEPSFPDVDESLLPPDAMMLATHRHPAVPLVAAGGWARFEWELPEGVDHIDIPDGANVLDLLATMQPRPGSTQVSVLANLRLNMGTEPWDFSTTPPPGVPTPVWHARLVPAPATTLRGDAMPPGVFPPQIQAVSVHVEGHDPLQLGTTRVLYHPFPLAPFGMFHVRRLIATPLGATADLAGSVEGGIAVDYEHRTSLGRDVYVRRTVPGTLSCGHRALLTVTSTRQLIRRVPGPTAIMRDSAELTVLDQRLDLAAAAGLHPEGGHSLPWTALTLDLERLTVAVPLGPDGRPAPLDQPFWVSTGSGPATLPFTATDHAGASTPVSMPVVFLPDNAPDGLARLAALIGEGTPVSMAATPIALAAGVSPGETTVTVSGASVATVATGAPDRPLLPALRSLTVSLDALAGLGQPAPTVLASFDPVFLASGLDPAANPAGRLLRVAPTPLGLPTAVAGGIGNPGGVVDTLTTSAGAVPGAVVDRVGQPLSTEEILQAFPAPKLFGKIDLGTLIASLPTLPQLKRAGPPGQETVTYSFTAALKSDPALGITAAPTSQLSLSTSVAMQAGRPAPAVTTGTVTGLTFTLGEVIAVTFPEIRFATDPEGRTTVALVGGPDVEFKGPLHFLEELARRLGSLGAGTGARVDVDGAGVTAGFELVLPTMAVGIVQIANVGVSAFLRIPFTDVPMSFTLDVARRERPFLVTVAVFGGGGWLSLETTPDGVRRLEAAIEFGGSMALDIIVASGGVTVMAGIYFGLKEGGKEVAFEAYVRASGHLSVLGIITVFVEFFMLLSYEEIEDGGKTHTKLSGRASVTVGIKVLFFSKAVTLSISREFVGSAADPTFLDCYETTDWDEYCQAFAGDRGPAPVVEPTR